MKLVKEFSVFTIIEMDKHTLPIIVFVRAVKQKLRSWIEMITLDNC